MSTNPPTNVAAAPAEYSDAEDEGNDGGPPPPPRARAGAVSTNPHTNVAAAPAPATGGGPLRSPVVARWCPCPASQTNRQQLEEAYTRLRLAKAKEGAAYAAVVSY